MKYQLPDHCLLQLYLFTHELALYSSVCLFYIEITKKTFIYEPETVISWHEKAFHSFYSTIYMNKFSISNIFVVTDFISCEKCVSGLFIFLLQMNFYLFFQMKNDYKMCLTEIKDVYCMKLSFSIK